MARHAREHEWTFWLAFMLAIGIVALLFLLSLGIIKV